MNSIKLVIAVAVTFLLVACGSGNDKQKHSQSSNQNSSSDGSGNNTSGSASYVTGEFKLSDVTDVYFPSDGGATGGGGSECLSSFNYNYFESANVLVYGDPNLPDSDFKHAATLVENEFGNALNAIGITRQEFDAYRPVYTPQVFGNLINGYLLGFMIETDQGSEERDISNIDTDFPTPDNWPEMSFDAKNSFVISYWNSTDTAKQQELVTAYSEHFQFDPVGYNIVPDKIVVCLDQTMDSKRFGQASLIGMNIAPKSVASRSDDSAVVLHELIHTIQLNVAVPTDGAAYGIDRWFTEGQATYLAGQNYASDSSGHFPVNVVDLYDEGVHFSDTGLAYEHYALAYKYLDMYNSKEDLLNFLIDMRYYEGVGMRTRSSGVSSDMFQEAFDANMHKQDGSPLTINDYRTNYHSINN